MNNTLPTLATHGRQRLEWLDCLRGFTMVMVVAYHVCQMSFGIPPKTSPSMPLLVLFRMPLFFFVSGFLAFKADMLWTRGRMGMMVWKKFKIQVIPTVVFLCVAVIVKQPKFFDGMLKFLATPTKGCYWFTWALLVMFVIYYVFAYVEQALSRKRHHQRVADMEALASEAPQEIVRKNRRLWGIILLWVVSLGLYELAFLPKLADLSSSPFLRWSSLLEVIYYFHFFLFGNIVHRAWDAIQRGFDSRWLFPVLTVVAFVCCADVLKWHTLKFEWANLPRTVAMYALMMLVVMSCRHYRETFSSATRIGRALQFIGQRTLDIYLLHYLFLPRLRMVGAWIGQNQPNFLLEVVLSIGLALGVVALCCLVSSVLRVSPFFRKYLFGRK